MWFFAVLFVASFLAMTLLAPKPKLENARPGSLNDFNFPRAQEGDPVARFWGTVKFTSPNTIGQCNFKTVAIKKKVKTGIFTSKKQIMGYKYLTGLDLALALGPCVVFRRIWYGKNEIWNGCLYSSACNDAPNVITINLPDLLGGADGNGGIGGQIALYGGSFDQTRDPYLAANISPNIPAYVGIAHAVFRDFYWGNSPNIEALSFELAYFSNSLAIPEDKHIMANGLDANPIEVLFNLHEDEWGNLGVNPAFFNVTQWREVALKVYDENNGISLICANANNGGDVAKEVLRQIRATLFEDPQTGLINIKLIRRDYVIADLPVLGPDEISSISNFTKILWGQTFNRMRVKFTDRANNYSENAVATEDDFANIRFQGRVRATEMSFPGIYVGELADMVAARELAQVNVPLYQCELKSNRVPGTLRPGDPFVLSWPEYEFDGLVLRVRKFGLGSLRDGSLSMTVVQDDFSTEDTVYAVSPPSDHAADPQAATDISEFVLFELPYWMDANAGFDSPAGFTRYGSFAFKPAPASMSYFGLIDDGTAEDTEALSSAPYSAAAKLVGTLAKFDGFATGVVASLPIKNVSDTSVLTNSTTGDISAHGYNLVMLNGEILAFETFTDNGDGTYNLNNVHRAMLDTGWVGGVADDRVWFFDGQEGFFDADSAVAPFTAYLLDRAWGGRSLEAGAVHTALVPVGRPSLPLPPDLPTIDAARALGTLCIAGTTVTVAWRERARSASAIALETDATGAPEAGTTYRVELVQGVSTLATASGIAVATYGLAIPADAGGPALVNVWAVRAGQSSFAPTSYPITIIPANALSADGDYLTADGDTLEA